MIQESELPASESAVCDPVRNGDTVIFISKCKLSFQHEIFAEKPCFFHSSLHDKSGNSFDCVSFIADIFSRDVVDTSVKSAGFTVNILGNADILKSAGRQLSDKKVPQEMCLTGFIEFSIPYSLRCQIIHVLSLVSDLQKIHAAAGQDRCGKIPSVVNPHDTDAFRHAVGKNRFLISDQLVFIADIRLNLFV